MTLLLTGTARGENPSAASIVFDNSFGDAGDAPSTVIDDVREYTISDVRGMYSGTGANLFHSFDQFSILTNEHAIFTAENGAPERIIARVTGEMESRINGKLTSTVMYERGEEVHAADIYLVNPYGITIGSGAELAVPGSLYLSTAHAIGFEDGSVFPAYRVGGGRRIGRPGTLLSSASPAYFGFSNLQAFDLTDMEQETFGTIRVDGRSKFQVKPGETLAFIGADSPNGNPGVDLESFPPFFGGDLVEIQAQDASVQIASAGGSVDIPVDIRTLDLASEDPPALGQVRINSFFTIDAGEPTDASTTGEVVIRGQRFALSRNSKISSASLDVAVIDDIQIAGEAVAEARVVSLAASEIVVTDIDTEFESKAGARVEGGSVTLEAGRVEVSGGGSEVKIVSTIAADGLLEIDTDTLWVERGGRLESLAENSESGGDIRIAAGERIVVSSDCPLPSTCGRSMITARSSENLPGEAGEIWIEAPILEVVDGGLIEVFDAAEGGDSAMDGITILASERVTIAGGSEADGASVVLSQSDREGEAGGLRIAPLGDADALRVEIHDGGQASASTSGTAAAGSVDITADVVEVTGVFVNPNPDISAETESGIFSQSNSTEAGGGPGGNVTITARSLLIGDHGTVGVGTRGGGDAGNILLTIEENLQVIGLVAKGRLGNIEANNRVTDATGTPGDIVIRVSDPRGSVVLLDGAVITAQSRGTAAAGSITIDAGGRFEATGFSVNDDGTTTSSGVTTASKSSSGGKITIAASELVYLLDGEISTNVGEGDGGGGDIVIGDSGLGIPDFVVLNRGRVFATAVDGTGGNIDIATGTFFASAPFEINPGTPFPERGSFLDATSNKPELTGTVDVEPPETELVTELASLPASFLDASALLGSACEARTSRAGSFQVVKRHAADLAPPDATLAPVGLHQTPGIRVLPVGRDLCVSPEEIL